EVARPVATIAIPNAIPISNRNERRRGAATKPAPAASASPTANRPASLAATIRLRTGLTDHNAEAVPHSRRHPSSIVAMVSVEFRLLRPADSTKPAAHSPAAEMSAATAGGST